MIAEPASNSPAADASERVDTVKSPPLRTQFITAAPGVDSVRGSVGAVTRGNAGNNVNGFRLVRPGCMAARASTRLVAGVVR